MRRTRRQIENRIQRIKERIAAIDRIHPGTLSRQYNVCGTPNCQCKADPPRKHGPYYQISFSWHGKSTSRFVKKKDLSRVKRQIKNYKRIRALTDEWIQLTMELSRMPRDTVDG